jgi:tetratricopeptide (TPR) repeat protein
MPTNDSTPSPRPTSSSGTWVVLAIVVLGLLAAAGAWTYWRWAAKQMWPASQPAPTTPDAAGAAKWDPKAARVELETVRQRFDNTGGEGDLAPVLADARRLVERYPRYADARTLLAQVMLFQGRTDAAYDQLLMSLDIDKQQPDVQLAAGNVAEQLGRIDEAARHYSNAADLAPRVARYRCFLANIYLKKKDTEHARTTVLEALALDSSQHEAYGILSAVYEQEGKLPLAIEQAQKAIEHTPADQHKHRVAYILRKSTLLRRDNRADEALQVLTTLSAQEQAEPAALYEAALSWAAQGQFDQAALVYEKVLADNPLAWKPAAEAAKWRIKAGDRAGAERDIEAIRRINPRLEVIAELERQLP